MTKYTNAPKGNRSEQNKRRKNKQKLKKKTDKNQLSIQGTEPQSDDDAPPSENQAEHPEEGGASYDEHGDEASADPWCSTGSGGALQDDDDPHD